MIVHSSDKPAICLDCVQVIHLLWSRDLKGTGGEWLHGNLVGARDFVVKATGRVLCEISMQSKQIIVITRARK